MNEARSPSTSFQSTHQVRRNSEPGPAPTLYFAYGSNLSFDQMARRCPGSRFLGRARLHGYSFQINQRGFANVIKTGNPTDFVDGLCYRLTENDERSLDRSEGVPTAYQKKELEAEFFPATADLLSRDVMEIVQSRAAAESRARASMLQPCNSRFQSRSDSIRSGSVSSGSVRSDWTDGWRHSTITPNGSARLGRSLSLSSSSQPARVVGYETTKVMVYLSTVYVARGRPWDEYIKRMKQGLDEALRQGVSIAYVNRVTQQWLRIGAGARLAAGEAVTLQKRGTLRHMDDAASTYTLKPRRDRRRPSESTRRTTFL